jgi:hypothetical protein
MFIPAVLANACNGIVAALEQLYYKNPMNMLEKCSNSNIELVQKLASLTWGDCLFTLQPNTIAELTKADGFIDVNGDLTEEGKQLVLEQMHSKFLGHHLLKLLTDSARQAIEQQSSIYTWISQSGTEEEVDGLTIIALILARICPNFKVDMYAEITKVKKPLLLSTITMSSCILMLFSFSSFKIRRIPMHTLRMLTFVISSFSSIMTLSLRNSDSNLVVKKLFE